MCIHREDAKNAEKTVFPLRPLRLEGDLQGRTTGRRWSFKEVLWLALLR